MEYFWVLFLFFCCFREMKVRRGLFRGNAGMHTVETWITSFSCFSIFANMPGISDPKCSFLLAPGWILLSFLIRRAVLSLGNT